MTLGGLKILAELETIIAKKQLFNQNVSPYTISFIFKLFTQLISLEPRIRNLNHIHSSKQNLKICIVFDLNICYV